MIDDEDFAWSDIMDDTAEGSERALVDVIGGGLMEAPVNLIEALWDPKTCPAEFLPLCAFNYGARLYEDVWSEDTTREWIGRSWEFESRRGTVAGIKMALAVNGFELTDIVRPPQGFYASPEIPIDVLNDYVRLQPEIRTTYGPRKGEDNGQWFAGIDFAEDAFAGFDDGAALFGRFAFLRRDGVDTPLVTLVQRESSETRNGVSFEQYAIPGLSTLGFFEGDHADDDRYVGAEEKASQIITYRVDESFLVEKFELAITTLKSGLEPYDMRVDVVSDSENPDPWTFANDAFMGDSYAGIENGQYLMADSVRLYDPNIPLPSDVAVSFADVDRVGLDLRTVELMVDLKTVEAYGSTFVAEAFAGESFAVSEDTSHEERAIRAIEAGRGFLDRTLVRFDAWRPLEVQDPVSESTEVGQWVRNSL